MSRLIRSAAEADIPAITEIYNQAIVGRFQTAQLTPVDENERRQWLASHNPSRHPVFVATDDSEVVGYCSLSPYRAGRDALKTTAEISYYLHRDHRGQGIGSALIEHAVAACPALGIKNLFAILLDVNTDSVRILKKFGFSQWGHMPDVAEIDGQTIGHLYFGRGI